MDCNSAELLYEMSCHSRALTSCCRAFNVDEGRPGSGVIGSGDQVELGIALKGEPQHSLRWLEHQLNVEDQD